MAGIGTYDAEGWTDLVPTTGSVDSADDSRIVYVSSSIGSNSYNGLSGTVDGGGVGPKATLEAGIALLRNTYPDWLRLKCGDTWTDEDMWLTDKWAGRSAAEPMVITSYGTGARPSVENGSVKYFESTLFRHFAIVGIQFYARDNDPDDATYDPPGRSGSAISIPITSGYSITGMLLENLKVRNFNSIGIYIQGRADGPHQDLKVRRNVIMDNIMGLSAPHGDNLLLEENIFIRNGWVVRDVFIHNVYLLENTNITARGNILAYGGNCGIKLSGDAVDSVTDFMVDDNLFFRNTLNFDHSAGPVGDAEVTVTHRGGTISDNIFIEPSKTLPHDGHPVTSVQSIATYLLNFAEVNFTGNIFAHNTSTAGTGIPFGFGSGELITDVTITGNIIWDWYSAQYLNNDTYVSNYAEAVNLTWSGNEAEDIDTSPVNDGPGIFPTAGSYSDPTRDIASYYDTLPGGSSDTDAFLEECALQEKGAWDEAYTAAAVNAWIREGFDITADNPATFGGDTSGECDENADYVTGILSASDAVDGMTTPNFTVTNAADHGEASINPTTGAWSYTPDTDYFGSDSFVVRVTDDLGNHDTQVITITVNEVGGSTPTYYAFSANGQTYVFQTGGA